MASTVYATFEDCQTEFEGTLVETDRPRIEHLLNKASIRLTAMVPALPNMLVGNMLDTSIPTGIVVEAVLKSWRNPSGASQQTVGPFNQSYGGNTPQRPEIVIDKQLVQDLILGDFAGRKPSTFRVGVPPRDPRLGPQVPAGALDVDGRYAYTPEQYRGL